MLNIIWMGRLFKDTIILSMTEDEPVQQGLLDNIENRIISLFNEIDILGNYIKTIPLEKLILTKFRIISSTAVFS